MAELETINIITQYSQNEEIVRTKKRIVELEHENKKLRLQLDRLVAKNEGWSLLGMESCEGTITQITDANVYLKTSKSASTANFCIPTEYFTQKEPLHKGEHLVIDTLLMKKNPNLSIGKTKAEVYQELERIGDELGKLSIKGPIYL